METQEAELILPDRLGRYRTLEHLAYSIGKVLDIIDPVKDGEMFLIRFEVSAEVLDGLQIGGSSEKELMKGPNDGGSHS